MQRTQTIPAAEQVALCRRAQAGDRAARDALVVASMGLVYSVAKRWVRSAPGLELDDLATEGVFGLLRAIEKFDCDQTMTMALKMRIDNPKNSAAVSIDSGHEWT